MNTEFIDSLIEHINAENDMSALLRMIPRIGIDVSTLQSLMKSFISDLDENSARKALFNVKPIDTMLPMDVLQHIAKFDHQESQREINKSFKKCFDLNQELLKRIREDIIQEYEHEFDPVVDCNETTNQIFILHPEGEISAEFEKRKASGHRVSKCHDLAQCINEATSGDKILIENGTYMYNSTPVDEVDGLTVGLSICDKHLQIMGIGSNVKLDFVKVGYRYQDALLLMTNGSHILFKNLEINFQHEAYAVQACPIIIKGNSFIWMEDCQLSAPHQLLQIHNSCIYMKSCIISCGGGIKLDPFRGRSTFTAIACTIDMNRCGKSAFEIQNKEDLSLVRLTFVGNIFKGALLQTSFGWPRNALFDGNIFEECFISEWLRYSNRVFG